MTSQTPKLHFLTLIVPKFFIVQKKARVRTDVKNTFHLIKDKLLSKYPQWILKYSYSVMNYRRAVYVRTKWRLTFVFPVGFKRAPTDDRPLGQRRTQEYLFVPYWVIWNSSAYVNATRVARHSWSRPNLLYMHIDLFIYFRWMVAQKRDNALLPHVKITKYCFLNPSYTHLLQAVCFLKSICIKCFEYHRKPESWLSTAQQSGVVCSTVRRSSYTCELVLSALTQAAI